jgi:hypothetical protein
VGLPVAITVATDRSLQIADWHVTLLTVASQTFTFETGEGGGADPNIKISVMDKCRMESATRTTMGEFYPASTVPGIVAVTTGVGAPGPGPHSLSFSFSEGISASALYTDNGDNTAQVNFCVLTGMYDGISLIDFAEVKLTYNIDLVTNIPSLSGYTVTQAEAFNDAADTAIAFDGTLMAYFCNATTREELTDDGTKTHQGSILNVCFKVPDGQFEIADVTQFTVSNAAAASPTQDIIIDSAPASSLYSTKECFDTGVDDTNVCLVSFLLKADFYDFTALTLTGTGSVLLEFGDATGSRRRLRRKLAVDSIEESVQVTAHEFQVDQEPIQAASSANSAMTSLAAFGAIAGVALVL